MTNIHELNGKEFEIVKVLKISILLIIAFSIILYTTYVNAEVIGKRHSRSLTSNATINSGLIKDLYVLKNLTSTLLESYGDELDPLVSIKLREIEGDIESGNIAKLSEDLEELERILRENKDLYIDKPEETKSLLSLLASYRISRKDGKLDVVLDPEKALDLSKLLNSNLTSLNNIEVINTLLKLASLVKDIDPENSDLLDNIVGALMKGDYLTASRLYSIAYSRLDDILTKLLEKGYISEDELKEFLNNLPTYITSDGRIVKTTMDMLQLIFGKRMEPEEVEAREENNRYVSTPPRLFDLKRISRLKDIGFIVPSTPSLNISLLNITNIIMYLILVIVLATTMFLILRLKPIKRLTGKLIDSIRIHMTIRRLKAKLDSQIHPIIKYYLLALEIMRRRGLPRLRYETPREYLRRLRGRVEYNTLETLTYLYEKVRFGGKKASEDEIKICEEKFNELSGERK